MTAAGPVVTPESSLRVATVYACVRILAETVASLPCHLYRRTADGGKERATDHPLYETLHDFPNAWQSALEFFEQQMYYTTLRGNGLAEIKTGLRGSVSQLVPIHPSRIKGPPEQLPSGELRYTITDENGRRDKVLHSGEVIHIRGMTSDGLWGLTPITHASTMIGVALASDVLEANQLKNGVKPSGTYSHPGQLGDVAYQRLKAQMAETGGYGQAGKTLILEEGMKWDQVSMTNRDAQFIEAKRMRPGEIARLFRMPPHMIGDHDKGASYASVEQQAIDFVVHTIRPWLVRIEQAIKRDLIVQHRTFFCEFLADALLRGDLKSRYDAYAIGIQNEILNPNECRGFENLNPYEGGDEYRNRITQPDAAAEEPETMPTPQRRPADDATVDDDDDTQAGRLLRVFTQDVAGRIASRELKELAKRAKHAQSDNDQFREWLQGFYTQHAQYVDSAIHPLCEALQVQDTARIAWVQDVTQGAVRALLDGEPEQVVEQWERGALAANYSAKLKKLAA
ncbi:MAG: phage portal protein [Phycisphaerales bacterium]|nr:phage portal protein [Phycisphaerales bacterium]